MAETMLPENSDAEMEAVVANTGFNNVPAATASPAVKIIAIDDDSLDDDAVVAHECKVEPNNASASDIANSAQVDGDVTGNVVGDTPEGVSST